MGLTHLSPELVTLTTGSAFLSLLQKLQDESNQVSQFAPSYDVKGLPFNGIRTFLKITQKYFYQVHAFLLLYKSNRKSEDVNNNNEISFEVKEEPGWIFSIFTRTTKPNFRELTSDPALVKPIERLSTVSPSKYERIYQDLQNIGTYLLKHFQFIYLLHEANLDPKDKVKLSKDVVIHPNIEIALKSGCSLAFEDLGGMYNSDLAYFWLPKFWRNLFILKHTAISLVHHPFAMSIKSFSEPKLQQSLIFDSSMYRFAPILWWAFKVPDWAIFGLAAWTHSWWKGVNHERFELVRQKNIGLTPSGQLITSGAPKLVKQRRTFSAVYLWQGEKGKLSDKTGDTLLVHLHGSAFCVSNADTHSYYLGHWCRRLNLPIYVPNYGKLPEHPFPYPVQDIIDSYLFLVDGSRKEELKKVLGFVPRNILLTGDSAGAILALKLLVALDEINRDRRAKNLAPLIVPSALAFQYPLVLSVMEPSMARTLTTIDPILSLPMMMTLQAAYLVPEIFGEDKSIPWFRVWEYEKVRETLINMCTFRRIPYVNPLGYKRFDEMTSQLDIFIQAAEMDSILDDSLELAKRWKGPCQLDVVPGTVHAFMAFTSKRIDKHVEKFLTFLDQHATKFRA